MYAICKVRVQKEILMPEDLALSIYFPCDIPLLPHTLNSHSKMLLFNTVN